MSKLPLKILSLGAGVQSSTVFLMSCLGVLPRLNAAIFADTQWEPPAVYDHLCWLEEQAAQGGIPVYRVTAGNLRQHTLERFIYGGAKDGERYATMPLHVLSPNGSRSMIRRQCTSEYKIVPIERFIRRVLLGLGKGQIAQALCVEQWFGISADEMRRVRISQNHWKSHVYPLIGLPQPMLERPYTRAMCLEWLKRHYPGHVVPRSACIGCPFHSDEEWRQIKSQPDLWANAVEVDEAIRFTGGMEGQVFLHRSCRSLKDVDLRTDLEKGQMALPFAQECLGLCGN